MKKYLLSLILMLLLHHIQVSAQGFLTDSCFMSCTVGTSFVSSTDLASFNADLIEWDGTAWNGGWGAANLNIPPPANRAGCRAIFIGSGTVWTTGGEGFAMRLNQGMISGYTYHIFFTYVSHGMGSNGDFAPKVYSNLTADQAGEFYIDSLPGAGSNWTNHLLTFTATPSQDGHTWIIVQTEANISSGLVSSMCPECSFIVGLNDKASKLSFRVSPNPCSTALTFMIENPGNQQARVTLRSAYGQTVRTITGDNPGLVIRQVIDMSTLPSGIYLLEVAAGNERLVKKIIKE